MASANLKQVLVHVKNSTEIKQAVFQLCILRQLGITDDETLSCSVNCYLEENKLILSLCSAEETPKREIFLKHPPFCPMLEMSEEETLSLPEDVINRGVNVGVAVVLESSDEKILVTRRAQHMRTFPGVWVPPGGHVELNETLEEAGLRELREETGLSISNHMKKSSDPLALWESVYPPVLSNGTPRRHHIVVYWHILVNKTAAQLDKYFKLSPDEVDATFWLPLKLTESVVSGVPFTFEDLKKLKVLSLNQNGEQVFSEMNPSVFQEKMPPAGADVERVSTGTRYAMEMWMKKKNTLPKSL